MVLSAAQQKFVLHWGEMGARWGINRTMAQIHALLYISPAPLHAEAVAAALAVARSNVSTSLRELQGWGIVRIVHVMGDRRDHFETLSDVWEMFQRILDERKRREIDPTIELLRECIALAEKSEGPRSHTRQRLAALQDFFQSMTRWYSRLRQLPVASVVRFVSMGDRLKKWLGVA